MMEAIQTGLLACNHAALCQEESVLLRAAIKADATAPVPATQTAEAIAKLINSDSPLRSVFETAGPRAFTAWALDDPQVVESVLPRLAEKHRLNALEIKLAQMLAADDEIDLVALWGEFVQLPVHGSYPDILAENLARLVDFLSSTDEPLETEPADLAHALMQRGALHKQLNGVTHD